MVALGAEQVERLVDEGRRLVDPFLVGAEVAVEAQLFLGVAQQLVGLGEQIGRCRPTVPMPSGGRVRRPIHRRRRPDSSAPAGVGADSSSSATAVDLGVGSLADVGVESGEQLGEAPPSVVEYAERSSYVAITKAYSVTEATRPLSCSTLT